jgi:hypothetical protein
MKRQNSLTSLQEVLNEIKEKLWSDQSDIKLQCLYWLNCCIKWLKQTFGIVETDLWNGWNRPLECTEQCPRFLSYKLSWLSSKLSSTPEVIHLYPTTPCLKIVHLWENTVNSPNLQIKLWITPYHYKRTARWQIKLFALLKLQETTYPQSQSGLIVSMTLSCVDHITHSFRASLHLCVCFVLWGIFDQAYATPLSIKCARNVESWHVQVARKSQTARMPSRTMGKKIVVGRTWSGQISHVVRDGLVLRREPDLSFNCCWDKPKINRSPSEIRRSKLDVLFQTEPDWNLGEYRIVPGVILCEMVHIILSWKSKQVSVRNSNPH